MAFDGILRFWSYAGTCLLFLILLTFITSTSSDAAQSHYERYTVKVRQSSYRCYPYTYTYCHDWYYWRYWHYGWTWGPYYYHSYWNPYYGYFGNWPACYSRVWSDCYWTSYETTVTRTRCQSGWSGSLCNVPICNPSCSGGQVCVDVNKCSCIDGQGASCSIIPCSPTNNCYPGSCSNSVCKCPAGFNGTNCEQITHAPSIINCKVKLYAKASDSAPETVVAEADCAAEGLEPSTTWVGKDYLNTGATNYGLTKIEPIWRADYTFPFSMPSRPTGATKFFISNAPVAIGIGNAWFNVSIGAHTASIRDACVNPNTIGVAPTTKDCDQPTTWDDLKVNSLLNNNVSFTVNMMASLGGKKDGDSTYQHNGQSYGFGSQKFTGVPAIVQAKFQFDLEPPTHCLLQSNDNSNCTAYPISLEEDIRTTPAIEPKFLNWTDNESGIGRYHVEVFLLNTDANDLLTEIGNPLTSVDITPHLNNFHFTAPKPGVYSIVLTTYDRANNSAKARKIFNFNDKPSFTTTSDPVYFQEANPATNYSFVKELTNRNRLTLKFTGRFRNAPEIDAMLSKRVKPWPIDPHSIDDKFSRKFGMRSIHVLENATGISSMDYCYVIDTKGGIGAEPPNDNTSCNSVSSSDRASETIALNFGRPLKDGETVVLWLTTMGATGTVDKIQIQTTVDNSRVNISAQQFSKKAVDRYTSAVVITAEDPESGINSTYYEIVDETTKVTISTGYAPAVTRDAPNSKRAAGIAKPCYRDDATCYCTPFRHCFEYEQKVVINHCDIVRFSGDDHRLVMKYRVSNLAGIVTSQSVIELGDISDLECLPTAWSAGARAGVIVGSIIGFLILVCLIALLILMAVRVMQHKHPVPQRMRTMASGVRKRLSVRHVDRTSHDNALYVSVGTGELPPKYSGPLQSRNYGSEAAASDDIYLDTEEINALKISRKQVQMGETLAEGKFAIVRKATLSTNSGSDAVAAKALRNGFGRTDELLMSRKIAFMRGITPHANIVRFMGAVDEGGAEGPIMLLELCETTLKDWLTSQKSISTDDLEMMLVFTLNIARGVEHLHKLKIIHRRLAVRNVLLKQEANGLVAKLIGFGPSAEDLDDGSKGPGTGAVVPVKWMALETLDTLGSKKPTYNEKTDAWSYGVTIWEMYSEGATPYSETKSADVLALIKRGHRLSCPKNCHPDLFDAAVKPCWNENPKQRPSFDAILRAVDEFRSGSVQQEGYYAADDVRGRGTDAPLYTINV